MLYNTISLSMHIVGVPLVSSLLFVVGGRTATLRNPLLYYALKSGNCCQSANEYVDKCFLFPHHFFIIFNTTKTDHF